MEENELAERYKDRFGFWEKVYDSLTEVEEEYYEKAKELYKIGEFQEAKKRLTIVKYCREHMDKLSEGEPPELNEYDDSNDIETIIDRLSTEINLALEEGKPLTFMYLEYDHLRDMIRYKADKSYQKIQEPLLEDSYDTPYWPPCPIDLEDVPEEKEKIKATQEKLEEALKEAEQKEEKDEKED